MVPPNDETRQRKPALSNVMNVELSAERRRLLYFVLTNLSIVSWFRLYMYVHAINIQRVQCAKYDASARGKEVNS
jgi:hypothetical protein